MQRLHGLLSRDLGAALEGNSGDPAYPAVLFFIFIVCFGALFITQGNVGHLMFIYLLIPAVFAPLTFARVTLWGLPLVIPHKFSFYNVFRNVTLCRTPLFLAVLIYGVNKAYLSYLYPEPHLGYLHIFFYYLLAPLLVFIVAFARLCVDVPEFYFKFFRLAAPIAALNAATNIYFFVSSLPNIFSQIPSHMSAVYGSALGYNPNQDGLIYVIYFVGLAVTLLQNFRPRDLYFSAPTLVVLLTAVLLSQSRTSLLGVFISFVALAFLMRGKAQRIVIITLALLLALVLIFASLLLPQGIWSYFVRGQSYRSDVWISSLNVIMLNPIFGFGERVLPEIPIISGESLSHAHSILLSSWMRGGIIGLASMIYLSIFGARRSLDYARARANFVPLAVFIVVAVDGVFNSELKVWQAGWEWAGYWLAIALVVGSDAKLRNDARICV